jgi:hypothetical protein
MMMIKTTLLLVAAAGLTGCAVYPAYPAGPYGAVYEPAPVYVSPSPVFIGGSVNLGYPRGHGHSHRHGPHGHRR